MQHKIHTVQLAKYLLNVTSVKDDNIEILLNSADIKRYALGYITNRQNLSNNKRDWILGR